MSYDVALYNDFGLGPVRVGDLDANITYNVGGMITAAVGVGLREWHGRAAADAGDLASAVISAIDAEPERYAAMNPANGWGSSEGLRDFMVTVRDECARDPTATFCVS